MLLEQDGQMVNVDPQVALLESVILRILRRHGPMKQAYLWYMANARRRGCHSQTDERFLSAIERLVQSGKILRSILRKNSFMLRIAPRAKRSQE